MAAAGLAFPAQLWAATALASLITYHTNRNLYDSITLFSYIKVSISINRAAGEECDGGWT